MRVNNKKTDKKKKRMVKKEVVRQNKINSTLFDNPMVRSIMTKLSPEEIDQYKKIGESLYGEIDFEKSEILSNTAPFISNDVIAYITAGINSGLHPRDIDEAEKNVLKETYGEKWFEKFGYSEDDLK